jgi:rod shape-determining protein MreC
LLDLKSEHGDLKTVGARVIAGSPTTDLRTFTIDKGFRDDVVKDLAVMVPSGVVGRVMTTASHTASVQVLLDRSAAAAARLEKSREQCIVLGIGEETLRIDYLSAAARPEPGETVLTSGLDGIYPEGLLIGKVETVDVKRRTYTVRPAASFSTLEEVLVVLTRPAVAGPRGRGQ